MLTQTQPEIEPIPQLPRETFALIVLNKRYDQAPGELADVTFTEDECERIEPLFKMLSQTKVTVMRDPDDDDLESYFAETTAKAVKLSKEQGDKIGATLLFHYLGHGATLGGTTYMILNQKEEFNANPYPIEAKLRSFASTKNSFVLGSLNCCRGLYKGKSDLGTYHQDYAHQLRLYFAAKPKQLATADEEFGKRYAKALKSGMKKGVLKLPRDLEFFQASDMSGIMNRPIFLTVQGTNTLAIPKTPKKLVISLSQKTKRDDENEGEQNFQYPCESALCWDNHIIGVSQYDIWESFQFITSDMQRSHAPDYELEENLWEDHNIPNGSVIAKVEIMYGVFTSGLAGLKFFSKEGDVLLTCGNIDSPIYRKHHNVGLSEFTLKEGERLIGVKSCGKGKNEAAHFDFQFVIGKME